MPTKTPALLTPEARAALLQIPPDLSDRDLARYYTLTPADQAVIARHRLPYNRLGFAVQLCMLRFPGRPLTDLLPLPARVLHYIAAQVAVDPAAFTDYGGRENTLYRHLDEIRRTFGYHACSGLDLLHLACALLPAALAGPRPLPLLEAALLWLRTHKCIVPGVTTLERLIWLVQRCAERQVHARLVDPLTPAQRSGLDGLLRVDPDLHRRSRLTWLREAPLHPSAANLRKILARLTYLHALTLPAPSSRVHRTRLLHLARHAARYQAQPLTKLRPQRRYALLVAYLAELHADLIDQALDMFDKLIGELLRKGERRQADHFVDHAQALNTSLSVLTQAAQAVLTAHEQKTAHPLTAVFAVVDEPTLRATVTTAQRLLRPTDGDSLDLIEDKYRRLRGALLAFYGALRFQAVRGADDPALRALDHVQRFDRRDRRVTALRQRIDGASVVAPCGHLTPRWRRHALDGGHIHPNFYEAAAFDALRARLRSGDTAVDGSRRYRTFESYLLPAATWRAALASGQTGLVSEADVQRYLDTCRTQITARLTTLAATVGPAALTQDAAGAWHLAALDRTVPEEALAWRRRVYARLPHVTLADVLQEVDGWTGCLARFTHLVEGAAPAGESRLLLTGAVMALGMNLGLGKMAQATPFSYRRLAWAADWYVREETITAAQGVLNNFMLHLPLAQAWGDGTRSSSDGMRVPVGVRSASSDPNPKYFGPERGVTFYGHVADIYMPFGRQQVISTNDREALYVIDTLCHHETELTIREHYTDTAGYTEHVFALCMLLDFRFAPRIRSVLDQRLSIPPGVTVPPELASLVGGRVRPRLIVDHWAELRRLAASIQQGTVSAALLMRKLAAYPRQNRLAQALAELGKLEKTLFILEYLQDEGLRRRVQVGLNKGEAKHALARALFFGRHGELWERAFTDQVHRASCLHLLIAAINTWNTVYLAHALAVLRAEGRPVPDEYVPHITPLGWEHINLLGHYNFQLAEPRTLDNLRPLRNEADIEATDDELHQQAAGVLRQRKPTKPKIKALLE